MDDREAFRKEERLKIDVVEVWNEVLRYTESEKRDLYINKNSRWKTIRIFVSSTFKDFHTERDSLVKEVFPELRDWCQKRYLNLVECDLRWGVPEETPNCVTLQICLDEIRRCEQENKWPFFLNMISKRIGWIPLQDELTADMISDFNLVIGLSATEMEIVEAAYRKLNPNSLFMWRDEGFLKQISDPNIKKEFLDDLNPLADKKISMLKQHIKKRYPEDQICTYSCDYTPGRTLPHSGRTKLQLNPIFKDKVREFFKKRIEELYAVDENADKQDKYDLEQDQHAAFMQQRASSVVGREDIVQQIIDYVNGSTQTPLVLLGESGSGKSTIMAKAVHDILENITKDTTLFFHFVGAVPRSTSLEEIMKRIIHATRQLSIPSRSNEVFEKVQSVLREYHNEASKRIVIFIDALNQLDPDDFTSRNIIYSWLPRNLPHGVKCVFSMIPDSIPHMILKEDAKLFQEEVVKDLSDLTVKDEIVSRYLMNFRKKLDTKQTLQFLNHSGSLNPLWLITACEELRCYGEFRNLTEYIKDLPSTLDELLLFVLNRICQDIEDKDLFKATICLMECSKNGLLEVELLEMLPMFETKAGGDGGELGGEGETKPRLISWRWGIIYRQLKSFIRPYGDSGEGRLDFYHKSMSKVVRENFLGLEYNKSTWKETCHNKMAIYFETSYNIYRKIEEYPYHLIELGQLDRLKKFLLDWEVIDLLFDSEWSKKLIEFWKLIDVSYASLKEEYLTLATSFQESEKLSKDQIAARIETIARIFSQAGLQKEAMTLGLTCRDILVDLEESSEDVSEETLEERKKLRMYVSGFLAHIETVLNRNYKKAIELHDDAIDRNLKLSNQQEYLIKRYRALQYIKKAFCMAELAAHIINPFRSSEKQRLREEGHRLCMEATLIYRDIKDYYHELEVHLTKATLCKKSAEVHQILEELMKNCKAYHGVEHNLMMRALYNDGTEYETEGNKTMAYNRFKAAYLLSKHLYGPGHKSTVDYLNVLRESKYAKVAKEKGECLELMTFDPNGLFSEG